MAVFKKQTKKSGKTILSSKWYGTLKTFDGKRRQVPLTVDRKTAETLLQRLQRDEDDKRANGVTKQDEQRQRPIMDHVDDFQAYMESNDVSDQHVQECINRVRRILKAIKAKTVDDLDGGRILKALSDWRKRKKKPISVATSNHYLVSVKSFSRWLWRERRTVDDALAGLRRQNANVDRKRVRRPLTPDELTTLTTVTQNSNKFYRGHDWQLSPTDRSMIYFVAAYTGFRVQELRSLRCTSFDFDAMTVTLEARNAKNKKKAILPLASALAVKLKPYIEARKTDYVWPGSWNRYGIAGKILKRDLKRAGIAYVDDSGRYADFHALRHTFITSLAKAGVHPSKAQRLARHSTISLTMDVYTTLDVDDLRDAIDSI